MFHIFIISCLCSRFHAWNQWFFYSIKTFSYTKYFVHSYTVDVVFNLSYWSSAFYFEIDILQYPWLTFSKTHLATLNVMVWLWFDFGWLLACYGIFIVWYYCLKIVGTVHMWSISIQACILLTIEAKTLWQPFCRGYFQSKFLIWKLLGFYQNVPKYVPQQYFSIGSDDDLVLPNRVKSTDDNQNLIFSEGGHNTSACQISGHLKWLQ